MASVSSVRALAEVQPGPYRESPCGTGQGGTIHGPIGALEPPGLAALVEADSAQPAQERNVNVYSFGEQISEVD